MRFVIFGAGAVGSTVGAHFSKAETDVLLIGDPPHIEKIQSDGLKMSGKYGEFVTSPPVCSAVDDWQFQADDVIFLCVKTYDTSVAIEQLRAKVPPETPVFCLQNTMTNEELVTEHFSNVYGAALHLGSRFIFPGEVGHLGGNSLVIGRYPEGLDETAERVVAALQAADMGGALTDDIRACKWAKFCINLMNAPAAILDVSGAEAFNDRDTRLFLGDMLQEAQHVLAQAEIKLKTLPGDQPLPEMVTGLHHPDFTPKQLPDRSTHVFPSMWQDVFCRRGRTEARYLNGRVHEMGQQLGVATPINALLTQVVDRMAERRELPGTYTLSDVRHML